MRLFTGIPVSEAARRAMRDYIDAVRPAWPKAKWVPPENLHLTMVFIGEVGDGDVGRVASALDEAAQRGKPFALSLGAPGRFPERGKARVLWVGVEEGAAGLSTVAAACAEALTPWVEPEARPYVAHLTIARFRVPERVDGLPPIECHPPSWTAEGVTLFRSRLGRPAPIYEAIHLARFEDVSGP